MSAPAPAERLSGVIALQCAVAAVWGGTWIAGRLVAPEMPPLVAASLRFLLGTLTLGLLLWRQQRGIPALDRADWGRVLGMGATGILAYNLCFFHGLQHIQAGRAALVIAINPVLIGLAAWALLGERLSRLRLAGMAIAGAGCVTVIARGNPLSLLQGDIGTGELAILGCALAWSSYTLIGRRASGRLSPLVLTFYASAAGGLLLTLAALATGSLHAWPQASAQAWWALAYLGILGSGFSYVWYAQGVARLGAGRAAAFINLVPLCALLLGAALLGERVAPAVLAGGGAILLGVWLSNRRVAATKETHA